MTPLILSGYASRVAAARARLMGGNTDQLAPNMQTATGLKFRAAFSIFANERQALDEGFEKNAQARVMIPDSIGITLSLGQEFTMLNDGEGYVAGDVFRVIWFLKNPLARETRVALRKLQR